MCVCVCICVFRCVCVFVSFGVCVSSCLSVCVGRLSSLFSLSVLSFVLFFVGKFHAIAKSGRRGIYFKLLVLVCLCMCIVCAFISMKLLFYLVYSTAV